MFLGFFFGTLARHSYLKNADIQLFAFKCFNDAFFFIFLHFGFTKLLVPGAPGNGDHFL